MIPSEIHLPFSIFHSRLTDFISQEYFVWIELLRCPTRAELRAAQRKWFAEVPNEASIFINVENSKTQNMRFARFFGFREVARNGDISIQVLKAGKCKP